jgi:hypothetical protein
LEETCQDDENFLKATKNDIATMSTDDSNSIKRYIDAPFAAVYKDMRSHTGATMTLGSGVIFSISLQNKRSIPAVLLKPTWWVLQFVQISESSLKPQATNRKRVISPLNHLGSSHEL